MQSKVEWKRFFRFQPRKEQTLIFDQKAAAFHLWKIYNIYKEKYHPV